MKKLYNMSFLIERNKEEDADRLTVTAHDSGGNDDKLTVPLHGVLSPYRMRKIVVDMVDRFFLPYGLETLMDESETDPTEMENEQNFFVDYKHFKTM